MNCGIRQYATASLMINMPKALPDHMKPVVRELTSLTVPVADRRHGLATKLLQLTCDEADRDRMALMIHVEPFDADGYVDTEALQSFYGRFGFVTFQNEPAVLMVRTARVNTVLNNAISMALN